MQQMLMRVYFGEEKKVQGENDLKCRLGISKHRESEPVMVMKMSITEHRRFLGQWNYPIWYHNGEKCHYAFAQIHRMYNTKSET